MGCNRKARQEVADGRSRRRSAGSGRNRARGGRAQERPGGDALLRLLEKLVSDGYSDLAAETVELAVPEEDAARVMEIVAEMGVAHARPTRRPRRGSRSARATREGRDAAGADGLGVSEGVAQAYLEAADTMGPPTPFGPQWRSCGPSTVTNGQTYGATRINVAGRVSALAVDPANPAHVLAGAPTVECGKP